MTVRAAKDHVRGKLSLETLRHKLAPCEVLCLCEAADLIPPRKPRRTCEDARPHPRLHEFRMLEITSIRTEHQIAELLDWAREQVGLIDEQEACQA